MAKDFRGNELIVGDTVVYSDLSSGVCIGKIAKITPKMVELDDKRRWDDFGTRRHHASIVKLEVTQ